VIFNSDDSDYFVLSLSLSPSLSPSLALSLSLYIYIYASDRNEYQEYFLG
jgi:hypothetical protein